MIVYWIIMALSAIGLALILGLVADDCLREMDAYYEELRKLR